MILAEVVGADRVADRGVGGARVLLDGDGVGGSGGLVGLLGTTGGHDNTTIGIGSNRDGLGNF